MPAAEQAQVKDLNYYLNGHMDEIPTDIATIEKLSMDAVNAANEINTHERIVDEPARAAAAAGDKSALEGATTTTEAPDDKKGEQATEGAAATQTTEAGGEQTGGEKIDGVLLKDGKRVLPYEVHHAVRMRAQNAETLVGEQAEVIENLKGQLEALSAGKAATETTQITLIPQDQIDAVKSEMPALGAMMESQNNALKVLIGRIDDMSRAAPNAADTAVDEAHSLIEQIPTLAKWEAGGNAESDQRWGKALAYDKELLADPAWKDKPDLDRFTRVVALTKAYFGDAPDAGDRVMQVEQAQGESDEAKRLALEAKAKEKLGNGGDKTLVPTSLSAIPGGAAHHTDTQGKFENMSAAQIGDLLMRQGQNGGADAVTAYLRNI